MYSSNFIDILNVGVTLAVTRLAMTLYEVTRYADVRLSYIKRIHEK